MIWRVLIILMLAVSTQAQNWQTLGALWGEQTSMAFSASGGVITTNGNYIIHSFTNSGTFTANRSVTVDLLGIGGGGGGGLTGGGGGAGGYLYTSLVVNAGASSILVGTGGVGRASYNIAGEDGSASWFGAIGINGGGGGGSYSNVAGRAGASGGGSSGFSSPANPGNGISGLGNNGGAKSANPSDVHNTGSGGGGAGSAGGNAVIAGSGSPVYDYVAGGMGKTNSISGNAIIYSKGGIGVPDEYGGTTSNAVSNTGNGGDGGGWRSGGRKGASGIIIIRYLKP